MIDAHWGISSETHVLCNGYMNRSKLQESTKHMSDRNDCQLEVSISDEEEVGWVHETQKIRRIQPYLAFRFEPYQEMGVRICPCRREETDVNVCTLF